VRADPRAVMTRPASSSGEARRPKYPAMWGRRSGRTDAGAIGRSGCRPAGLSCRWPLPMQP